MALDSTVESIFKAAKEGRWSDVWPLLEDAASQGSIGHIVSGIPKNRRYGLIHQAAYFGDIEALKTLVGDYGADVTLKTKEDDFVSTVARRHYHDDFADYVVTLPKGFVEVPEAQLCQLKRTNEEFKTKCALLTQKLDAANAEAALQQTTAQEKAQKLQEQQTRAHEEAQKLNLELAMLRSCVDAGCNRVVQEAQGELETAHERTREVVRRLRSVVRANDADDRGDGSKGAEGDCAQASVVWMVVSTPIRNRNGEDVMGRLQGLRSNMDNLLLAFDWPGSANSREADAAKWEALKPLVQTWIRSGFSDEASFSAIRNIVFATLWYQIFAGMVKGHIRAVMQSGSVSLKCVLIEGGPVSRCEAFAMPLILHDALEEVQSLGGSSGALHVVTAPSVESFEEHMREPCLKESGIDGCKQMEELRRTMSGTISTSISPSGVSTQELFSGEQVRQVDGILRSFDVTKDGYIDRSEFHSILQRLDPTWAVGDRASKLFDHADVNSDGKL